ncbi:MAG TPA: kelch repeat-containing protein [Candidatus Limnocylindrales bacterium]|nr:kelch repeat-containing protein [Candidatus Limnocylindrales bacterium]
MTDFDRMLESWLSDAGPSRPSAASVAEALATARTLGQRRGLRARVAGVDPWPRERTSVRVPRTVLALVAVGLLVLALASLAAVGARLVERVADPAPSVTFTGPYPMPVPATKGVEVGDGTVLVFGGEATSGQGAGSASNDTEQILRLDVGRNELTPIGTTPGTVVSAIALRNGDVLLVLPGVPARNALSVIGILRPATGELVMAGQTIAPHLGGAAVQLGPDDPRVLFVGGGADSTAAELFDPRTNAFAPTASTRGTMSQPRAVLLGDGSALVVGEANRTPERFDPTTETWSPVAPMSASREGFSVVAMADGRVLVVGGLMVQGEVAQDGLLYPAGPSTVADTAEVYDPATDTWTTVGPLVHPRWMHAALALRDGSVLLVGGTASALASASDGGRIDPVISEAERFDPATDSFRPAASLEMPRLNPGVVGLANGQALVLGSLRPSMLLPPDAAGDSFERYGGSSAPPVPDEVLVALDPVPADLVGRWVAEPQAGLAFGIGSGRSILTLTILERHAQVNVNGRPDRLLSGEAGVEPATGRLVVVANRSVTGGSLSLDGSPLERCTRGDTGGYVWELGPGTLGLRGDGRDPCASRPALLNRRWLRSAAGPGPGGPAIVETVDPPLALDLPLVGWMPTSVSVGSAELEGLGNFGRVGIWQDPAGFADGCELAAPPVNHASGVDPFLAVLRETRGLEIVDVREDAIGGGDIPATRVEFQETGECGDAGVAAWQPRAEVGVPGSVELAEGSRTIWLFEAEGSRLGPETRTLLVEVRTRDIEEERAILDSIRPVADITPAVLDLVARP